MHGLIFVVSDIIRKNSFNGSLSTTVDTSGSHKVTELCTAACIMSVFMTLKLHELRPPYLAIVALKNKTIINMVRLWRLDIRHLMAAARTVQFQRFETFSLSNLSQLVALIFFNSLNLEETTLLQHLGVSVSNSCMV